MKYLFEYNWQRRKEWFDLFKDVSDKELNKKRVGGLHSINATLFHIVVVEYYWICDIQKIPVDEFKFTDYPSLKDIVELSEELHPPVKKYVSNWNSELEKDGKEYDLGNANLEFLSFGEIVRHVIVHEIHHCGQLSIWARELDLQPFSARFIQRGTIFKILQLWNLQSKPRLKLQFQLFFQHGWIAKNIQT